MLPPFDLQGGVALAATRDIAVTFLLSAFGTIGFRTLVAPDVFAKLPLSAATFMRRRLLLLAQISIFAATLGMLLWAMVQTADMADTDTLGDTFAALPTVILKTSFGHVIAAQIASLLVLALVIGWRDGTVRQRFGLAIASLAVALQAGHSHAASMIQGPSLLLGCDIVHLLGAGAWLGGLVPLLLVVRDAPPRAGALAARLFSPLGQWCIVALAASALWQGWVLVASLPALIGTAYGWLILVKLGLFGVLFGFAVINRYRFAPALLHGSPEIAKRVLLRSITLQTGFGLAIVAAAVVLSELPPSMHTQTVWPFAKLLSLDAVREDPDFLREVLEAGLALAGAAALLVGSLLIKRFRLPAVAVTGIVAWLAIPHLDLLLADAYPTSFYHSPTGFSSEAIVEGSTLYDQHCVACHGAGGHGDGPLAGKLPVPPADLTAAHLWMHSDGELFWWIGHGMRTPEGAQAMPGFAPGLDDDQVWALIDYIRAHNAGVAFHATGRWPHPVQAPNLQARCGGVARQLADFRGHYVRLVIGDAPAEPADAGDVITIVTSGAAAPGKCVAADEGVALAYGIVGGLGGADLPGTQFLIDDNGWLRAVRRPMGGSGWDDARSLAAEIANLRAHKVTVSAGEGGPMKMDMNMKMPM
jgi:putative copper export protein/mono/diheme cytochrome c family protein